MNKSELLQKIIAFGVDEKGIRDYFDGNADLYISCFVDFLNRPAFVALRDAIHSHNYEQAFEESHTLTGLSHNLGITDFYNAIFLLTDFLGNKEYGKVDEQFAEVERQHERLKQLTLEKPTQTQEVSSNTPTSARQKFAKILSLRPIMKKKNARLFVCLVCVSFVFVALIGLLFYQINTKHSKNVELESGQHLSEINYQIKQYIEEHISTDWSIAQSVGDSITNSAFTDSDPAVLNMMRNKQTVWDLSDIMLYTENGYCVYADGSTALIDIATATAFNAREHGRWLSIIDSSLFFTVPLDTTMTFHGSRIVAVSVVRDMSTFLDEMNFSSFDDAAWMYLTNENGVVITSLSNPSASQAYNIQAVVGEKEKRSLDEKKTFQDFLSSTKPIVFLFSQDSIKEYGVSTQIVTDADAENMRLFYFVPTNIVNDTMSGFSEQLSLISFACIFVFTVFIVMAFIFLYKNREEKFDRTIHNREQMFDLLITKTKTAFALYEVNQQQPEYQSTNLTSVTGDSNWWLEKTDIGIQVHNKQRKETDNIGIINETLRDWDGKSIFRSEYLSNLQGSKPTYFILELYPVNDGTSKYIAIVQDVTQIYIREEAVKEAMERERKANNAKTSFLSSMSHDIRTPMNAIMNLSNFALESIDQPEQLDNYLRVIHESAEHLLHLVNDILDMSRIESGRVVIASVPLYIIDEMQHEAEIIQPLCNAKNQTLVTDFSKLTRTLVSGDALKLSQIIINLLSNATKFTPEKGTIKFTASEVPSLREDIISIRFSVQDNGRGIPQADVEHIFEPFNRSSDKAISRIEGTGLGLAIVKNYVEAMGGLIRCESQKGKGTIFTVELFFNKAVAHADQCTTCQTATNESFLGMRALIAEDNSVNQMIARNMLEKMGFITDIVDDGEGAVQKFCKSKPYTYDVIYMDIRMPILNGYDATMKIRASKHTQANTIPIVAMTANAFDEDIEKARLAGMDGYVSKPILSANLIDQTEKAINKKRGELR